MGTSTHQRQGTRRSFLKAGFVAGATMAASTLVPSDVLGRSGEPSANERIHLGVLGLGVRGKYLIGDLPEAGRVAAICDCADWKMSETLKPKRRFAQILARFRKHEADRCATHRDYRRMLEREKLDAVITQTEKPAMLAGWKNG